MLMVCVFPELVWPYAITVPFTPRSTASTTDLAARGTPPVVAAGAEHRVRLPRGRGGRSGVDAFVLLAERAGRVSTTRVPSSAEPRGGLLRGGALALAAPRADAPRRSARARRRRPSSPAVSRHPPPALDGPLAFSPRGRFMAFGGGDDPGFAAFARLRHGRTPTRSRRAGGSDGDSRDVPPFEFPDTKLRPLLCAPNYMTKHAYDRAT